ncbi:hypothetical protein GLYMA_11G228750v4 [Glycine max]|nr:hypothetical protein GLYMA_11G228750v4 [Glycine max]
MFVFFDDILMFVFSYLLLPFCEGDNAYDDTALTV